MQSKDFSYDDKTVACLLVYKASFPRKVSRTVFATGILEYLPKPTKYLRNLQDTYLYLKFQGLKVVGFSCVFIELPTMYFSKASWSIWM